MGAFPVRFPSGRPAVHNWLSAVPVRGPLTVPLCFVLAADYISAIELHSLGQNSFLCR